MAGYARPEEKGLAPRDYSSGILQRALPRFTPVLNARALFECERDNLLPWSDDELSQVFFLLQTAKISLSPWIVEYSTSHAFANLYFCSIGWQQQLQKRLYCTISPDAWFSKPEYRVLPSRLGGGGAMVHDHMHDHQNVPVQHLPP